MFLSTKIGNIILLSQRKRERDWFFIGDSALVCMLATKTIRLALILHSTAAPHPPLCWCVVLVGLSLEPAIGNCGNGSTRHAQTEPRCRHITRALALMNCQTSRLDVEGEKEVCGGRKESRVDEWKGSNFA